MGQGQSRLPSIINAQRIRAAQQGQRNVDQSAGGVNDHVGRAGGQMEPRAGFADYRPLFRTGSQHSDHRSSPRARPSPDRTAAADTNRRCLFHGDDDSIADRRPEATPSPEDTAEDDSEDSITNVRDENSLVAYLIEHRVITGPESLHRDEYGDRWFISNAGRGVYLRDLIPSQPPLEEKERSGVADGDGDEDDGSGTPGRGEKQVVGESPDSDRPFIGQDTDADADVEDNDEVSLQGTSSSDVFFIRENAPSPEESRDQVNRSEEPLVIGSNSESDNGKGGVLLSRQNAHDDNRGTPDIPGSEEPIMISSDSDNDSDGKDSGVPVDRRDADTVDRNGVHASESGEPVSISSDRAALVVHQGGERNMEDDDDASVSDSSDSDALFVSEVKRSSKRRRLD